VSRGLLTRYFLDEAASGTTPTAVQDAAPDPLPLPLDYGAIGAGGGMTAPNMSFTEVLGHRGLTWQEKNQSGSAFVAVAGSKLIALDGSTEATIECVADVQDAGGGGVCNRFLQLGANTNGTLTLCTNSPGVVSFRLNGTKPEEWNVGLGSMGRTVLHLVLDTQQANPDDRVRLFVDGVARGIGDVTNSPPAAGDAIALSTGDYVLGNRISGDGALLGTLYYCAVYTVALTVSEITQNTELLEASDDTQP
jgi:hypothetical protein